MHKLKYRKDFPCLTTTNIIFPKIFRPSIAEDFFPMIYLVLLAVLWIVFPLGAMLRPAQLSCNTKIADAYKNHHRYVRMTFTDLKFSGYTCETYGQTRGYYYYTTQKNNCSIILLTPHTCEEGLPTIDRLTVTGRIVKGKESYLALLSQLSSDLNWKPVSAISCLRIISVSLTII